MSDLTNQNANHPKERSNKRPVFVTVISGLVALIGLTILGAGFYFGIQSETGILNNIQTPLAGLVASLAILLLARGLFQLKDWARTTIIVLIGVLLVYYTISAVFDIFGRIFAGEQVVPLGEIASILLVGVLNWLLVVGMPALVIYGLVRTSPSFNVNPKTRNFIDRSVRQVLLITALSSIFIVFLIILFTMSEAWLSIQEIGLDTMLLGTIWRPGSIIGNDTAQFGLVPMVVGSILSTFGAVVLGVPLSIGTAILLAEVAPNFVREIVRPAVELLAGIPSVVYGLFGMVVLAPMIREIEVSRNTGFGLLNASIILAVMILPTVTNIAEDALRAVPNEYRSGSLALGATKWQTIVNVILPAARSGLIASVILGIGRALGETMALIMVIGNSIAIPTPLNNNPLTLFLNTARTLTGNVAVEINYAEGAHRSALFFTGILLFAMIFLVNRIARYLMRERA